MSVVLSGNDCCELSGGGPWGDGELRPCPL